MVSDPEQPTPPEPAAPGGPPGIGPGIATGCGLHVLALTLMVFGLGAFSALGFVWPFVLVALAAAVLMFWKPWRRFATGILIVAAAMWLVFIGPCLGILVSAGQTT